MALIDQWRSQRKQRQTETQTRSAQVQRHIKTLKTQRQAAAEHQQNHLHQFRTNLAEDNAYRQLEGQERQANLQAYTRWLIQEIQDFNQQTQNFLNTCRTEHSLMSDELVTNLQEGRTRLETETKDFLIQSRNQRQTQFQELQAELSEFIEDLHLYIETYFQELDAIRLERQEEIQDRQEEIDRFKHQVQQKLSNFRHHHGQMAQSQQAELDRFIETLHNHRLNLYQSVWGESDRPSSPRTAQPARVPSSKPSESPVSLQPKPDRKTEKFLSTEEEQVYNFLRKSPASRLSAIEGALGINRIRAVDTLRSLVKKGMITQRDRLYSVN